MSQYTIPTVIEKDPVRRARVRHLLPAVVGSDRLLGDRDRRRRGERRDGTAAPPRVRSIGPGDRAVHQLSGRLVQALTAIYDTMQFIGSHDRHVLHGPGVVGRGRAARCRHSGRRSVLRHAKVMLHQPSSQARGTLPDLAVQAKEVREGPRRDGGDLEPSIPATRWRRSARTPTGTRPSTPRKPSSTGWPTRSSPAARRSGRSPSPRPRGRGRRRWGGRCAGWQRWSGRGRCGAGRPWSAGRPLGEEDAAYLCQELGQLDFQRVADGGQHLRRGLFAATFELGEVRHRDLRRVGDLGQGPALRQPDPAQYFA